MYFHKLYISLVLAGVVKHSVESMSDKTDRCLEVLENSQDKRERAFVAAVMCRDLKGTNNYGVVIDSKRSGFTRLCGAR